MTAFRYPPDLPVSARREEILAALRRHPVIVVAGETGSGKTTQLPKMCLEARPEAPGWIGCTQPRRVAALSVSRRVAEELGVTWGREVGCKIRFANDTARETRIKFMTDGILLAEIPSDPLLRRYHTLILDEAHERSLNLDFLLGHLRQIRARRPDLKIVITSATIDTGLFAAAFDGAPVIEVTGRSHPVEVRYRPPAGDEESEGWVAELVTAIEEALIESDDGDVLAFLATERDIREAKEVLEGRLGAAFEVLGLYGRMAAGDQQRIFAPGRKRRVILATNVAETSLTIPRIRAVVDTGLARISRYNPRTRTRRLPVEPVAQSNANQRAGRAGRLGPGLCYRLYAEEDFRDRPVFGTPEIQRANLAEVILRLRAFQLGDIERFPFLSPPQPAAIRAGYAQLQELGALDADRTLTPLGREMARLPVDPALGRMLIQGRREGVLAEVLVIAAGLSIPDPRERPEEVRDAAAAAHKAFAQGGSDFLTLLAIWQAAPRETGHNALRRFCRRNFLSFVRLREWRDIHRQLAEAMGGRDAAAPSREPGPELAARIHRSILSALIGQIARREERNVFKTSGSRVVQIHPGSVLHQRREGGKSARQPDWVVAGEIVQTSQLFARLTAGIDPAWAIELGSHLCERTYVEPHWNARAQRVVVTERVVLHGLELARNRVDYGRIAPEAATEIFIRSALVENEDDLPLRFHARNRALRHKIETALTRRRAAATLNLDDAFFAFYAARLTRISSVPDLNRFLKSQADPDLLVAREEDLLGGADLAFDRALFPDRAPLGNTVLPLQYAFAPGEEKDGVTVRVPLPAAGALSEAQVTWMVPGLREEQIRALLRALPKTLRRQLHPLEPKVREVVEGFVPGDGTFLDALAGYLETRYGVRLRAADWPEGSLPDYLRPRIEVHDCRNRAVASGRDVAAVREAVEQAPRESDAWQSARTAWRRGPLEGDNWDALPDTVIVERVSGLDVCGYPGLCRDGDAVFTHLFASAAERDTASAEAVRVLLRTLLARDLAWAAREAGKFDAAPGKPAARGLGDALAAWSAAPAAWGNPDARRDAVIRHLETRCFHLEPILPLSPGRVRDRAEEVRKSFPAILAELREIYQRVKTLRETLLASRGRYPGFDDDLRRLAPEEFFAVTPPGRLRHLPRYLRAMQIRAERAAANPVRDAEKVRQLQPFLGVTPPENVRETFRWLLEEFRVSLFAQELGTAEPVSATRLRALLNPPAG